MGLVMVNAMDKIVLFLIITAVTTQALQIAGIVDTPISSVDIKLNEPVSGNQIIQQNINDLNKEMEATTERSQFIDALFNIPIKNSDCRQQFGATVKTDIPKTGIVRLKDLPVIDLRTSSRQHCECYAEAIISHLRRTEEKSVFYAYPSGYLR